MKDRHKIASQYMTEKYLTHFNRVNKEDIHLDQADKQKININNGFTKKNCPKDVRACPQLLSGHLYRYIHVDVYVMDFF